MASFLSIVLILCSCTVNTNSSNSSEKTPTTEQLKARAAAKAAQEELLKHPNPQFAGAWVEHITTNEMDGNKSVILTLHSGESPSNYMPTNPLQLLDWHHLPALVINCSQSDKRPAVYVQAGAGEYISDRDMSVRLKFDNGLPQKQHWLIAASGQALHASDKESVINEILRSRTFLFEYTPFRQNITTLHFDVNGLNYYINRNASLCGWKYDLPSNSIKRDN